MSAAVVGIGHLPGPTLRVDRRLADSPGPADYTPGMTVTQQPAAATEDRGTPPTFGHFIAGEWCDGVSGETFESRNPADSRDVIGQFQAGNPADAAMAIKAAETAFPMWNRTPAPKRGEILYRFGALMAEHKERLSQAMSREMGKVI